MHTYIPIIKGGGNMQSNGRQWTDHEKRSQIKLWSHYASFNLNQISFDVISRDFFHHFVRW